MYLNLSIAWRNLWRNKRRTIITSASVFFAVFFAVVMRSYQLGSYDRMILNFIESYSGYLQVQHVKYQDNPSVDYSFSYSDSLADAISQLEKVVSVAPHIESFALAASGSVSKGVAVLAIDTEKEREFSNPENKLVKYRITTESIERLKTSGKIPEPIMGIIANSVGSLYSSEARLELDLGLTEEEIEEYVPVILDYIKVTNAYL